MYTIICDGFTIFEPTVPDLMIDNATCSLEVNAAGSAQFDIYPDNPYFGQIQYLKSVLENPSGSVYSFPRETDQWR